MRAWIAPLLRSRLVSSSSTTTSSSSSPHPPPANGCQLTVPSLALAPYLLPVCAGYDKLEPLATKGGRCPGAPVAPYLLPPSPLAAIAWSGLALASAGSLCGSASASETSLHALPACSSLCRDAHSLWWLIDNSKGWPCAGAVAGVAASASAVAASAGRKKSATWGEAVTDATATLTEAVKLLTHKLGVR